MTKAESFIYNSPLWRNGEPRTGTKLRTGEQYTIRVYERVVDGEITHTLACDSYYGDSILNDLVLNTTRNIEAIYDEALPALV